MAKELTIILITQNRELFYREKIRYFEKHLDQIDLIIADSSVTDIASRNREYLADLLIIDKVTFLQSKTNENPFKKIHSAIELVSTEYFALSPDDDVLFVNNAILIKKDLENSSSVKVGIGLHCTFNRKERCVDGTLYTDEAYTAKSPLKRVQLLRTHYIPVFYAVLSKRFLLDIFQALASQDVFFDRANNQSNFVEHFIQVHVLALSRVLFFDKPYSLYDTSPNISWKKQSLGYLGQLNRFISPLERVYNLRVLRKRGRKASKQILASVNLTEEQQIALDQEIWAFMDDKIAGQIVYNRKAVWSRVLLSSEIDEANLKLESVLGSETK